jgi:NADPH-dependent 2,4-dienoyl-CoA reductase/sulfur reductase-like enzyme
LPDRIVIIGAGQAGGNCAQALRQAGFAGSVTLLGEEAFPPYERPPLSKELLAGKIPVEKTFLRPSGWYAENHIALELGAKVVQVDRAARRVTLEGGGTLDYDALVFATGADVRRLPAPGADHPNVRYVRTISDTLALRERLVAGHRLVVVGAGFIGLEVAATGRELGATVTVVEIAAQPMARVTPPELGRVYLDLHRARDVEVLTNTGVTALAPDGAALALTLSDGRTLVADTVVVGIGIAARSDVAAACGLAVENGIVVDEFGRTADPAVWAAGDCAAFWHPALQRRLRLEAWQHAQNHAIAVAKNILGPPQPYSEVPWAWSDQYGINLQIAGAPAAWDSLVWRGDPAGGKAILFQLQNGALVGGATMDMAREMRFIRQLITSGRPVDPAKLADPAVKLQDLAKG